MSIDLVCRSSSSRVLVWSRLLGSVWTISCGEFSVAGLQPHCQEFRSCFWGDDCPSELRIASPFDVGSCYDTGGELFFFGQNTYCLCPTNDSSASCHSDEQCEGRCASAFGPESCVTATVGKCTRYLTEVKCQCFLSSPQNQFACFE